VISNDHSVSHEIAPGFASSTNAPKQLAVAYAGCSDPLPDHSHHPIRNWHGPHVPTFSRQVNYYPVILSALNIVYIQCGNLTAAESTGQEN
jgi:hypothetical protein